MTLHSLASTESVFRDADPQTITFAFGQSTLGHVLVAQSSKGICAVLIGSDRDRLAASLRQDFPEAQPAAADARHAALIALIEAPQKAAHLELDIRGSEFEVKVWQALRAIPAGRTMSYSALAETIGMKGMAREVGEACAANRIAVAVPCHRILRKDGSISGYRWGVHRKRALLQREGAI